MEASGRPSKIRKLSHDKQELLNQLPDLYQNPTQSAIPHDHKTTTPIETRTGDVEHLKPNIDCTSHAEKDVEPSVQHDAIDEPTQTVQHLSKNQLRKLRKKQEWEAGREDRKVKRREKTKEKKERKREQRHQEAQQRIANGGSIPQPPVPKRQRPILLPITFLIDCGFDDKMVDKERMSLGSQLTRAYSDNSKAPYQAHLVVSSWGGSLKERFDTVLNGQHRNWKGMQFLEADFVQAAKDTQQVMTGKKGGRLEGVFKQYASNHNNNVAHPVTKENEVSEAVASAPSISTEANNTNKEQRTDTPTQPQLPPSKIDTSQPPTPLPTPETIYLTSDSPNTLTHLTPYSTYIIGGIVDKNRHKGLCYQLACDRDIKTAKLPIGEFMEMQSRFVLATNHVVEIMLRWLECGDWGESFMRVIPKRKGGKLKGQGGDGDDGSKVEEEREGEGGDGVSEHEEEEREEIFDVDRADSELSDTEPTWVT